MLEKGGIGEEFSHEGDSITEAKANLSLYRRLCHKEPVIITVNGVPKFELVPLDEDDDLVDHLIQRNPQFRRMIEARLKEKSISAKEAMRRL